MSGKKILLGNARPIRRGQRTSRQDRTNKDRGTGPRLLPFAIRYQQRQEAVGLMLIGIASFMLTLLHFLATSKVSGAVNWLMVQIGLGVYVLPAILGLMGVQQFLDRPFSHVAARIAGTVGTLLFGLGLLGLEGGKLGTNMFLLFSGTFGPWPTRVLFAFLTLSSLIFALDILYQELLLATLGICRVAVAGSLWAWEFSLYLLSMLIDAFRATFTFFAGIVATALKLWPREQENTGQSTYEPALLPFPAIATDAVVDQLPEPPANPVPTTLPEIPPANPVATIHATPATVVVASIPSVVCLATMTPVPTTASSEDPAPDSDEIEVTFIPEEPALTVDSIDQSETSPDESGCATGVSASIGQAANSPTPPLNSAAGTDNDRETAAMTGALSADERSDTVTWQDVDAPEYLDENPIDRDIKKMSHGEMDPDDESESEEDAPRAPGYTLPPLTLLANPPARTTGDAEDIAARSQLLVKTLADFGIQATVTDVVEGPAVSRFELKPAAGVKVSRIVSLTDDIAMALAATAVRIEAPIPGKAALGIEIPNPKPTPVFFYDLVANDAFVRPETLLNLALGVTISGKPVYADLTEMPHLLIAGSTGSGKSVCINTIIASILFQARPDQVKLVMIDPKMVELSSYNGIPHLISPVVTDPKLAAGALLWAVEEMSRRYELLATCGVRNIGTYNADLARLREGVDSELQPMPLIVIIIDELADLMMTASAEVEGSICRLAQMARAVGIHLVIATQRPSVDVITGIIKANLPSRIAFSVASQTDSRTILDGKGAEKLLGKGDMLFVPKGRSKPLRVQGAFIGDAELERLSKHAREQGTPDYIEITPTVANDDRGDDDGTGADVNDDANDADADGELLSRIETWLATQEKTSTSMLQRKFKIGYNRAARLTDLLEEKGLIGPQEGAGKRRVIKKLP